MARSNHDNDEGEIEQHGVTEQSPLLSDNRNGHENQPVNGEIKTDLTIVEYAASLSQLKLYTILGSIWVRNFLFPFQPNRFFALNFI